MTSCSYRQDSTAEAAQASLQQALDTISQDSSLPGVWDSIVLCLLLLHVRWLCLGWLHRKHFQAQLMRKPGDALISERQSINVAKIMLCNSRKLCKPTSSSCHTVGTQTLYVSWVVGLILVSPSCPGLAALLSFFWSMWLSLPACCCLHLCS